MRYTFFSNVNLINSYARTPLNFFFKYDKIDLMNINSSEHLQVFFENASLHSLNILGNFVRTALDARGIKHLNFLYVIIL